MKGKATVVETVDIPAFTKYEIWAWASDDGWTFVEYENTQTEAAICAEGSDYPTCIIKIEIPAMTIGEKK